MSLEVLYLLDEKKIYKFIDSESSYETAWTKLFFQRDKGRTFGAIAKLIVRRLGPVVAIERAIGRVSETLGKAAQGSASLGRISLPNIQAPSTAAYRRHGAKIRVKLHDRSTRLFIDFLLDTRNYTTKRNEHL